MLLCASPLLCAASQLLNMSSPAALGCLLLELCAARSNAPAMVSITCRTVICWLGREGEDMPFSAVMGCLHSIRTSLLANRLALKLLAPEAWVSLVRGTSQQGDPNLRVRNIP